MTQSNENCRAVFQRVYAEELKKLEADPTYRALVQGEKHITGSAAKDMTEAEKDAAWIAGNAMEACWNKEDGQESTAPTPLAPKEPSKRTTGRA